MAAGTALLGFCTGGAVETVEAGNSDAAGAFDVVCAACGVWVAGGCGKKVAVWPVAGAGGGLIAGVAVEGGGGPGVGGVTLMVGEDPVLDVAGFGKLNRGGGSFLAALNDVGPDGAAAGNFEGSVAFGKRPDAGGVGAGGCCAADDVESPNLSPADGAALGWEDSDGTGA